MEGDPSYRVPPPEAHKLTPVQRQILLFLGTGGPAYISTGTRTTRCGMTTGGDRWVATNTNTLWSLEHHRLVAQIRPGRNEPFRANRDHPAVRRLLGGRDDG